MRYLAIDKNPYSIAWALFDYDTKKLLESGEMGFYEKTESARHDEMWKEISELLNDKMPNGVISHWVDRRHTLKKDLEHMFTIKTILRKLCADKNITYNEFKTYGWEQRLADMKNPSPTAKLRIAREYVPNLNSVEIANAIILGEGVVWNRLQIGRE